MRLLNKKVSWGSSYLFIELEGSQVKFLLSTQSWRAVRSAGSEIRDAIRYQIDPWACPCPWDLAPKTTWHRTRWPNTTWQPTRNSCGYPSPRLGTQTRRHIHPGCTQPRRDVTARLHHSHEAEEHSDQEPPEIRTRRRTKTQDAKTLTTRMRVWVPLGNTRTSWA